jgi:hypothetical protein
MTCDIMIDNFVATTLYIPKIVEWIATAYEALIEFPLNLVSR